MAAARQSVQEDWRTRHSLSLKPKSGGLRPSVESVTTYRTSTIANESFGFSSELLRGVSFFAGMDPRFTESLIRYMTLEVFQKGEVIIQEGDSGDKMFYLHRGNVEVCVGVTMRSVATINEGNVFGELAVFGCCKRKASIRSLGFTECRTVHKSNFHKLLRSFPKERDKFQKMAAERLAENIRNKSKEKAVRKSREMVSPSRKMASNACLKPTADTVKKRNSFMKGPDNTQDAVERVQKYKEANAALRLELQNGAHQLDRGPETPRENHRQITLEHGKSLEHGQLLHNLKMSLDCESPLAQGDGRQSSKGRQSSRRPSKSIYCEKRPSGGGGSPSLEFFQEPIVSADAFMLSSDPKSAEGSPKQWSSPGGSEQDLFKQDSPSISALCAGAQSSPIYSDERSSGGNSDGYGSESKRKQWKQLLGQETVEQVAEAKPIEDQSTDPRCSSCGIRFQTVSQKFCVACGAKRFDNEEFRFDDAKLAQDLWQSYNSLDEDDEEDEEEEDGSGVLTTYAGSNKLASMPPPVAISISLVVPNAASLDGPLTPRSAALAALHEDSDDCEADFGMYAPFSQARNLDNTLSQSGNSQTNYHSQPSKGQLPLQNPGSQLSGQKGHFGVELLKRIKMFSTCNSELLERLLEHTTARTFWAGTTIFREGSRGTSIFIILKGRVNVSVGGVHLTTLSTASVFGEMASFCEPTPEARRCATVTAKDHCDCWVIDVRRLPVAQLNCLKQLETFPLETQRRHLEFERHCLIASRSRPQSRQPDFISEGRLQSADTPLRSGGHSPPRSRQPPYSSEGRCRPKGFALDGVSQTQGGQADFGSESLQKMQSWRSQDSALPIIKPGLSCSTSGSPQKVSSQSSPCSSKAARSPRNAMTQEPSRLLRMLGIDVAAPLSSRSAR